MKGESRSLDCTWRVFGRRRELESLEPIAKVRGPDGVRMVRWETDIAGGEFLTTNAVMCGG